MIEVIAGTDRPGSRTLVVARHVLGLLLAEGAGADLIDLAALDSKELTGGDYFKGARGGYLRAVERVTAADGLVVVVPEYNGSYPGILKLFIDYWRYPDTFEHRPIALVGLGSRWGGLRAVEHLQQAFGFRNSYVYPNRVFLSNIKDVLKNGAIADPLLADLLETQARGFIKFIHALKHQAMDANSILQIKPR